MDWFQRKVIAPRLEREKWLAQTPPARGAAHACRRAWRHKWWWIAAGATVLVVFSFDGPNGVFTLAYWTEEPADLRNLSLALAAPAALYGLWLAHRRTAALDLQARTAEQGHITDRFTRAIEQLGSDRLEVRLGAIYALERIARDSKRDHWPIMETLTAFVRENAPWPPKVEDEELERLVAAGMPDEDEQPTSQSEEAKPKPRTDIQAIMTVIGRRERGHDPKGEQLYLRSTDLRGAKLAGAHLEDAILTRANLERADLPHARLEGALLLHAHLEDADLWEAHLVGANVSHADLLVADLLGAHLERADLRGRNLTQMQVDGALGDEETKLPKGLTRPANWVKTNRPPNA